MAPVVDLDELHAPSAMHSEIVHAPTLRPRAMRRRYIRSVSAEGASHVACWLADPEESMSTAFSPLETNILQAKGLSAEQVSLLAELGIAAKTDFTTVGDAATLQQLIPGLDAAVASEVMAWATGAAPRRESTGPIVVESPDVVYCVHCKTKQPKDYSSGDLCTTCGKQAEPILSCYWCTSSGPGVFCRQCGAEFVPTAELELAMLLKREGIAKDAIPTQLKALTQADKDVLWGRVRKSRG